MKVRIEVDCTPDEARAFLGLPDVKPFQDALMAQWQSEFGKRLAEMGPEAVMKAWFPAGTKGWEELQKAFWTQFTKKEGS
jgi:hypothetical protein